MEENHRPEDSLETEETIVDQVRIALRRLEIIQERLESFADAIFSADSDACTEKPHASRSPPKRFSLSLAIYGLLALRILSSSSFNRLPSSCLWRCCFPNRGHLSRKSLQCRRPRRHLSRGSDLQCATIKPVASWSRLVGLAIGAGLPTPLPYPATVGSRLFISILVRIHHGSWLESVLIAVLSVESLTQRPSTRLSEAVQPPEGTPPLGSNSRWLGSPA